MISLELRPAWLLAFTRRRRGDLSRDDPTSPTQENEDHPSVRTETWARNPNPKFNPAAGR